MKTITPTVNDLVESGLCDAPTARRLREILRGKFAINGDSAEFPKTAAWLRQCHNLPKTSEMKMAAANELLGLHGVECVHKDDDGMYGQGSVAFTYLNAGDTYTATLVRRGPNNYRLSTMGDEVERLERRGVAVK